MKYMVHTLITTLVGIAYYFIGEKIYNKLIVNGIASLTLPIYFLSFAIIISITLWILSIKRGKYFETRDKKKKAGEMTRSLILTMVVLVIVSGVLEFLYELGGAYSPKEASSYVFIIDDSGSMNENDPMDERRRAIGNIINEMNTNLPYAVYIFNSECQEVKPMSSDIDNDFSLNSNGGTDIVKALKVVYSKYNSRNKIWGDSPKVLLLTDGNSSSSGLSKILRKYKSSNISISTVGFGSADSNYLKNIADKTGGVNINSNQISMLKSSMEEALKSYSDGKRNLLSDRLCKHDGLYAFIRIVFLIIISALIAKIKANAMYDTDSQPIYYIISLLLGIIASILMEVMISHLLISTGSVHCVCCILWAIVPADFPKSHNKKTGKRYEAVVFDDEERESDDSYQCNIDDNESLYDDSFNDLRF